MNLGILLVGFSCYCSVAQSCPTLCNPMDRSTPGFPVHHQLPELGQTHVSWVSDTIQPSHPLLSPSPSAFNLHQDLFKWASSSHQVAKVLELQHQFYREYSGLISFRIDWFDFFAVQGALPAHWQMHSFNKPYDKVTRNISPFTEDESDLEEVKWLAPK